MLGLDDTSEAAINDVLSFSTVCDVFENGVIRMAAYNWGQDRINQAFLPLDFYYQSAWKGQGVDVYVLDTGLVRLLIVITIQLLCLLSNQTKPLRIAFAFECRSNQFILSGYDTC